MPGALGATHSAGEEGFAGADGFADSAGAGSEGAGKGGMFCRVGQLAVVLFS